MVDVAPFLSPAQRRFCLMVIVRPLIVPLLHPHPSSVSAQPAGGNPTLKSRVKSSGTGKNLLDRVWPICYSIDSF
ncbi:MAG: hypothetical protein JXQ27_15220 [Acidobacteria bacterium]|nr:hypothetical protein [Acidobacteriota bacterium]